MSKLLGNIIALAVNTGTTIAPVWKDGVCITTNGLASSSSDIDAGSKCGEETVPGFLKWTGSVECLAEKTPTSTQVSINDMIGYAIDQQIREWKMYSIDDDGASYYRQFNAFISNYQEKADYNTVVSFSCDFNVSANSLVITAPAP